MEERKKGEGCREGREEQVNGGKEGRNKWREEYK